MKRWWKATEGIRFIAVVALVIFALLVMMALEPGAR